MKTGSLKKKLKKNKKKKKKGGCSIIRACSLIRSNTVLLLTRVARGRQMLCDYHAIYIDVFVRLKFIL